MTTRLLRKDTNRAYIVIPVFELLIIVNSLYNTHRETQIVALQGYQYSEYYLFRMTLVVDGHHVWWVVLSIWSQLASHISRQDSHPNLERFFSFTTSSSFFTSVLPLLILLINLTYTSVSVSTLIILCNNHIKFVNSMCLSHFNKLAPLINKPPRWLVEDIREDREIEAEGKGF